MAGSIENNIEEFTKSGLIGYDSSSFYPAIFTPATLVRKDLILSHTQQIYLELFKLSQHIGQCQVEQGFGNKKSTLKLNFGERM